MRLITLFLIFFLVILIKTESILDQFSIEGFKEYVKDNGLFEIIFSIKMLYGQDVAIISCEELNENYKGNCKRLVIEYMPESSEPLKPSISSGSEDSADGSGSYDSDGSGSYDSDGSGSYDSDGSGSYDSDGSDSYDSDGSDSYDSDPSNSPQEEPKLIKMPYMKYILSKKFDLREAELIYDKIIKKVEESEDKI